MASWVDGFEFSEAFRDLRNGEGADHARVLQAELKGDLLDKLPPLTRPGH